MTDRSDLGENLILPNHRFDDFPNKKARKKHPIKPSPPKKLYEQGTSK